LGPAKKADATVVIIDGTTFATTNVGSGSGANVDDKIGPLLGCNQASLFAMARPTAMPNINLEATKRFGVLLGLEAELTIQKQYLEANLKQRDYKAAKTYAENIVAIVTEMHKCSVNIKEEPCVLTVPFEKKSP
jgi:hypothetical protein